MKPSVIEEFLHSLPQGQRHAWFGEEPVVKAFAFDFLKGTNARLPKEMHGAFDAVWLVEKPLIHFPRQWRAIADEAIRLLKTEGHIIAFFPDNNAAIQLKNVLWRSLSLRAELVAQDQFANGSANAIFKIERLLQHLYKDDSWTIGILSDGRKVEVVKRLVSKLESIKGHRQIEYVIAGPKIDFSPGLNVRYVMPERNDDLPRIGEKKLLIANEARNINLALFHDRYAVNDDFFAGFDDFGYDFDFVTVAQTYEDGEFFPGYLSFRQKTLYCQLVEYTEDFNSMLEGTWVNGGLIILKTHIAKKINFNSLLLHNEAEDVEQAFLLQEHGIYPRVNPLSSAVTVGTSVNHTATYAKISGQDALASLPPPARKKWNPVLAVWMTLPSDARVKFKKSPTFLAIRRTLIGR